MSYVGTQLPKDILCQVSTYRLAGAAGSESYGSTATATFTGGIVPLSAKQRALLGGNPVLTMLLLCDDTANIAEGDKVVVVLKGVTTEYRVYNLDLHNYGGHPHREAVLSRVES